MICPKCSEDRKDSDFLGKDTCYKCQFKEKVKKLKQSSPSCKQCGKDRPVHRWAYCSESCQQQGAISKRKTYWVRNIKTPPV